MLLQLVNLTPHALVIHLVEPERADRVPPIKLVKPLGDVPLPRVDTIQERLLAHPIWNELAVPTVRTTFGSVSHLPAPQEGRVLIVSGMVLDAIADAYEAWRRSLSLSSRTDAGPEPRRPYDLAAPGELVRDPTTGQPIGCLGLRVRPSGD